MRDIRQAAPIGMSYTAGRLQSLGEQMQWTVFDAQPLLGGFCVLPSGQRASFVGSSRVITDHEEQSLDPSSQRVRSQYSARHLGPITRELVRDESLGRVVISYEFQTPYEQVTATFETLGGYDLHLLNASEHLMDDLIYR